MPGVPREVIEHCLNVKEGAKPVKQRLRRFAQDRKEAIRDELTKLTAANFIREVYHPDWLANPVLVKKKNGKWRMCVDYTDLNKACPKDPFGLPRIDQVVDSTAGSELLCFLDAYSGYHQVSLAESDCIKTSFITPFGAYCYITMPFGLKNAGATYQRAMQRCLHDQLGRNVEAYVDDVVIKSRVREDLIPDLSETFTNLRRFRWKLNPEKCVFGVPSGKLLGFIVSYRGIEVNPKKLKDILMMNSPYKLRDVQKLTGCMAALSRFVSRLGERAMPFYKLLKKQDKFQWTPEAQQALDKLKKFLTNPPVLVLPMPEEPLLLYITATSHVDTAIVVERQEEGHVQKGQRPMYFDGSLMIEGVGAGIVLISLTGEWLKYVLQIYFPASNNAAEYEALLHGLCIAISLGIRRLAIRGDSELVVNQVQKEYSCTNTKMSAFCQEVRKLEGTFDGLELTHVLQNDNNEADET